MARCAPLYSHAATERFRRARVELAGDTIFLTSPDGRQRNLRLHGCHFRTLDATCSQRFVRQLILRWPSHHGIARVDLITPPDQGTIAPRVARLPSAPDDAAVLEAPAWDAIAGWLARGGRIASHTVAELARLACIATPHFARALGEIAARAAAELLWEDCGPMRGSGGVRNPLRPFEEAARHSPRAADALLAALSVTAPREQSATP